MQWLVNGYGLNSEMFDDKGFELGFKHDLIIFVHCYTLPLTVNNNHIYIFIYLYSSGRFCNYYYYYYYYFFEVWLICFSLYFVFLFYCFLNKYYEVNITMKGGGLVEKSLVCILYRVHTGSHKTTWDLEDDLVTNSL